MFQNLTEHMTSILQKVRGQGRLTEDNIKKALREVRKALLDADVGLDVAEYFLQRVKKAALGHEVAKSLNPGQAFIKIVKRELIEVMGNENHTLTLNTQPPAVILMAGLQGSGKTTSSAKLARFLKNTEKKKVLMVSLDVYRPAAIAQLQSLGQDLEIEVFPSALTEKPVRIAEQALTHAKRYGFDVLIADTAGRLHVDAMMMQEIKDLHAVLDPIETLFVIDSMAGQDAVLVAKAFDEALPLTGVILTKADGDARGGAALSVRHITGKPIKFMGVGEKTEALQPFHPERIASRILGMGDVLSLIEDLEDKVDRAKADKIVEKIKKGKGFDFSDFAEQLEQVQKMGGMSKIANKIPGFSGLSEQAKQMAQDKTTTRSLAMIYSMTPKERADPDLIKGSRRRRIAQGSGTQIQDVNKLLKQFEQIQKAMKQMGKKGGMAGLMRQMQSRGNFPPGMMGG